jgi:dipeptidyl-peptidase-3
MLIENTYGKNGLYGKCIEQITKHLSAAADLTENELQRKYILKLIGYYESGSLESWDEYNIMWVGDTDSRIDFINGFIESYNDPLGRKGSWEGNVEIEDMEGTARTTKISAAAQEFEDASPVDPRFKKKKVSGISAKAINVACLGGDCYPSTPIGINLPNADWIRKAFGSKSVTIANITEAYYKSAEESPNSISSEFYYRDEDKRIVKEYGSVTGNVHTDLHECLGHGSGQLLPGVSANALGEYGSALEEARADLYALYFIADSKMVDMGILPNGEAYKAEYLKQIVNGLMIQFARVAPGKTNTEAHMQDRQLISQWSYEHGMNEGIIRKIKVNGKTFFEISDYGKLRSLFGLLLGEIQRIKSEGDYEAGKNLIEKYATEINPEIHREVIKRYSALGIKPYKGFINPCIIKVRNNDGSFDYKIKYEEDFIKQMLSYGSEYSFL